MHLLALDQASVVTGWAVADPEGPGLVAWGTIEAPKHWPLAKRLALLFDTLHALAERYLIEALAVEQIHVHRNVKTSLQLAKVAGVLELFAFQKGLTLTEVHPIRAREALLGRGDATKEEVRAYLTSHFGLDPSVPLDASDACLIALYASARLKGHPAHADRTRLPSQRPARRRRDAAGAPAKRRPRAHLASRRAAGSDRRRHGE